MCYLCWALKGNCCSQIVCINLSMFLHLLLFPGAFHLMLKGSKTYREDKRTKYVILFFLVTFYQCLPNEHTMIYLFLLLEQFRKITFSFLLKPRMSFFKKRERWQQSSSFMKFSSLDHCLWAVACGIAVTPRKLQKRIKCMILF